MKDGLTGLRKYMSSMVKDMSPLFPDSSLW